MTSKPALDTSLLKDTDMKSVALTIHTIADEDYPALWTDDEEARNFARADNPFRVRYYVKDTETHSWVLTEPTETVYAF